MGSPKQCEILNCDYREIPSERKFDAISAVEMAEHVGIANFGLFLHNVREMLADDGIFYMQVAGLRKGSNWQDTQWGLFMSRYIFPGADASTPLFWYVKQLEMAGFEVKSVETVGRHYSHTLKAWYKNWMKNKDKPELARYADVWKGDAQLPLVKGNLSRLWEIFLAWSTVASGIGSATCYQAEQEDALSARRGFSVAAAALAFTTETEASLLLSLPLTCVIFLQEPPRTRAHPTTDSFGASQCQ